MEQARQFVAEGRRWVVDIDLEKFFDRVNHDILMDRIERKLKDERITKLIRGYLRAGIMEDGLTTASTEGTPQGGPLSPLLSNILLNAMQTDANTPFRVIASPAAAKAGRSNLFYRRERLLRRKKHSSQ